MENNNLSLPNGMVDYGKAQRSLAEKMLQDGATPDEISSALTEVSKGDLPEGANITKVIVEGYKDGVLIAGAWYLGPAATMGKVVGGSAIGAIANGTYQWLDINSEKNQSLPKNQQKTWDYKGSVSAGITGALAPGRNIWQNAGLAAGGTLFTDGPDKGALTGTGAGWVFGTVVGVVAPPLFNPVLGSGSAPVGDIIGLVGESLLVMLSRMGSMKRKNNPTIGLLFLSIGYMVFCCLIFFSLALVTVKFAINHNVNIEQSDIKNILVASVIAGTAAALRSWIFAKLDECKARKTPPSDPD